MRRFKTVGQACIAAAEASRLGLDVYVFESPSRKSDPWVIDWDPEVLKHERLVATYVGGDLKSSSVAISIKHQE